MAQRDVVLRWIEQLGKVIARLIRSGTAGDLGLARDQVGEATAALLGALAQLAPRLDVASAADLIRDPERIFGWAQLIDLLAAIDVAEGRMEEGAAGRARAVAAAREAVGRATVARPEWTEWLAARDGDQPLPPLQES